MIYCMNNIKASLNDFFQFWPKYFKYLLYPFQRIGEVFLFESILLKGPRTILLLWHDIIEILFFLSDY